ncbi:MAG: hypothetical protein WCD57_26315 [Acidobacteriaceae bacterium]
MSRVPEVAAALVCQVLVTDLMTQSKTLANIFGVLHTPVLPAFTSLGLYVKMIDGEGKYALRIRFVRVRDDKAVLDLPVQEVTWAKPLDPLEVGVNFQQVPIEEEGMHEFQIYMDDVYVGRAPFRVKKFTPPNQTGGKI